MTDRASASRIAVGDHVRLSTFLANDHQSFQVSDIQVSSRREPLTGLVLSIRDIKTGQLLSATRGGFDNFVIELLYDSTFNARYASLRNAPRGVDRVTATPAWRRLRASLREMNEKGEFCGTTMPNFFTESPIAKFLDGWKVVKVHASEIENLEENAGASDAE